MTHPTSVTTRLARRIYVIEVCQSTCLCPTSPQFRFELAIPNPVFFWQSVVGVCFSSFEHSAEFLKTTPRANVYHCLVFLTLCRTKLLFFLKKSASNSGAENRLKNHKKGEGMWQLPRRCWLPSGDTEFCAAVVILVTPAKL